PPLLDVIAVWVYSSPSRPKTQMNTTSIRVVARVSARVDKLEETLEAFRILVDETRKENGCITYEALRNVEEPYEFTFVEEWESAEALENHFATEHFQALKARGN